MKFRTFIAVVGGVSILLFIIVSFGLFHGIELSLTDRLFTERPVDSRVVVVAIDARSLAELGQWPLPRALIADGLQKILGGEPRAVGIDIIFADPSRLGEADDQALETVLKESSAPIILPVEALSLRIKGESVPKAEETLHTLPRFFGTATVVGHVNLIQDRDGVVRRFPRAILTPEGDRTPSFSAQVVGKIEESPIERIVWSGQPGTIPHVPFVDVVNGTADPSIFKDAYVFLGATAQDLHDEQTTPVSAGTAMAGVEIQAQIGNMLLKGYALRELPLALFVFSLLALIIASAAAFFFIPNIFVAIFVSLAVLASNLIAAVVLFEKGILPNIVHTSLAVILSSLIAFSVRYFILERERREIKGVFSKYVSKAVLDELLKDPKKVALGGVEAEVTVFFSDVRGFTSLSEKLSPSELTKLLNHYLTRMTDIILRENGVVDKYIGDAIMAFWGAPLPDPMHAHAAVKSSLAMLEALDAFNAENAASGQPPINIGIGLNTGTVVVGNMGSAQRFDYTIMGDAVNLCSRLEGQTKTYGVRVLASEMTIAALRKEASGEPAFLLREIDRVTVKGKTEPVALFEVVEKGREAAVRPLLEAFNAMREAYYRGAWHEAVEKGKGILAKNDDAPTRILLERAEGYLKNPPKIWRGVYELTSK